MDGLQVEAVGFDLDFTLWDQEDFARSFFVAVAADFGRRLGCGSRAFTRACVSALDRLTLAQPRLFDQVLHQLGAWYPRLVAELVERYHQHRPAARPYPGAEDTLGQLKAAGLRLFLVTDGRGPTQRSKVEALGLAPWFDPMIFTGELPEGCGKPDPYPFRLACRRLALAPDRCAYVGDNPERDFAGPRSLGMLTIGVATGPYARLAAAPGQLPRLRIGRLEELVPCLIGPVVSGVRP